MGLKARLGWCRWDNQHLLMGVKNQNHRGWLVKMERSRKNSKASESGGDTHGVALGTAPCLWTL